MSSLFRKEIIDLHSIRFCLTCGNYAEDLAFMLDYVLYCNSTCCIEKAGYCYVQREDSMMHSSQKILKFNELNEVSFFFGQHYLNKYSSFQKRLDYSIIHYLIMYTEYSGAIWGRTGKNYSILPKECKNIRNKQWFNQNQKRLLLRLRKLRRITKEKNNVDLMMIAKYSIHCIPLLFKIESALNYKFLQRFRRY